MSASLYTYRVKSQQDLHDKLNDGNTEREYSRRMRPKNLIGVRIRAARKSKKLTLKALAHKTKSLSPSRISNYEQGLRTPGPDEARELGSALGESPAYLLGVEEKRADYNVSPPAEVKRQVPVISWVAAGKFCHSDDPFPPGVADEWVGATANVGPRAYALRVDGDSMEPRFPDGCTIIVDPEWEAKHKSFVVVRLEGSDETTFKQLMAEGGKRYLKPLNPRYPIIELSESAVICGVVRQSLQVETFE